MITLHKKHNEKDTRLYSPDDLNARNILSLFLLSIHGINGLAKVLFFAFLTLPIFLLFECNKSIKNM
jgi:hypothetical protein